MDMDLDSSDGEGVGAQHRCDFPGCDRGFSEEEEWKLHIRMHIQGETLASSSNVTAPSSAAPYGHKERNQIAVGSPSSSRSTPARNVSFSGVYSRPDARMGPYTGPSTFVGPPGALTGWSPYPTDWTREDTPEIANQIQRNGRDNRMRDERNIHRDRGHPYLRPPPRNAYDVTNDGDQNETYNSSHVYRNRKYDRRSHSNAVVHVHVHDKGAGGAYRESDLLARSSISPPRTHIPPRYSQSILPNPMPTPPAERSRTQSLSRSSSLTSRDPGSPSTSTSHLTPRSSQDTLYNSTPTPPSQSGLSPRPRIKKGKRRAPTRSQRYESLLFECGLGFPLWIPSPRCTSDGELHTPEIGDVGVFSHESSFNTIFNITQPPNSPANRDGIPEGVTPSCVLKPRWVTTNKRYHRPRTTIFQPEGAISKQRERSGHGSSVLTFDLSEEVGALLVLPQGGTLQKLEKTSEFKRRVRLYWRQWYEFADDQVDQALYLVTGFERCSAWAMAAWDSISSYAYDERDSLELTVDDTTGACKWAFQPARCSTQESDPPTPNDSQPSQETVFIRGFRIDRFDGSISSHSSTLSLRPGEEKDGNEDSDSSRPRENGFQGPPSSGGSSSHPPSSAPPSFSGGGSSGAPGSQSDSLDPPMDKAQVLELDLNLSSNKDDLITHPCAIINKFALELLSKIEPAVLDTSCVAFSHDEDWISIIEDSDEKFPSDVEVVHRICSKFKFTIDGDAIYTVAMTDSDKALLDQREAGDVISALVVFAEDNNTVTPTTCISVSQPVTNEENDVMQLPIPHSRRIHNSTRSSPEPALHSGTSLNTSAITSGAEPWILNSPVCSTPVTAFDPSPALSISETLVDLNDWMHGEKGYGIPCGLSPLFEAKAGEMSTDVTDNTDEQWKTLFPALSPSQTSTPARALHRRNIAPDSLIPLDVPTQPRRYITPSATSWKEVPATFFQRKKKMATAVHVGCGDDERDGDAELPPLNPDATEKERIEHRRRRNTLAARRSRKRKLEYQQGLESENDALKREVEALKSRTELLSRILKGDGMSINVDAEVQDLADSK